MGIVEDYEKDILRLLETVKYLQGIAARGEGREQREDETVEQFVLGYVKKLECALRQVADEPNIDKARAIADAILVHNARLSGAGPASA